MAFVVFCGGCCYTASCGLTLEEKKYCGSLVD